MTSAEICSRAALTPEDASRVRDLVAGAAGAQDSPALSDRALLQLTSSAPVSHLVAVVGGELVGYAQLTVEDSDVREIELVSANSAATEESQVVDGLLQAAIMASGDHPLRLWAHGSASPAHAGAQRAGFVPTRSLLQLRRPLASKTYPLPPSPPIPEGVVIRAFHPGEDDKEWLRVNSIAFAEHPEQGSWTRQDLDARIVTDWFDAAGFLVAMRDKEMLGFHWTKVHPGEPPLGEVYILGVDPRCQGMRLGKLLLIAGLRHLEDAGLHTVMLYVDAENKAAVRLYEGLGFSRFTEDVQYSLLR